MAVASTGKEHHGRELRPNLDRLTVGVDLGDQWSHYCILGLEGETLAEGQLRTMMFLERPGPRLPTSPWSSFDDPNCGFT